MMHYNSEFDNNASLSAADMQRTLMRCGKLAVVAVDLQGKIVQWSDGACALYGYSAEDSIGAEIARLEPVSNVSAVMRARALAENRDVHCEMMRRRGDGSELWASIHYAPIAGADGSAAGLLELSQDATVRRTMLDRLSGSQRRYHALLELLPDIVYVIDPGGYFTFVNESVRCLGYTVDDLLGQHFSVLLHPDDYQRVARCAVLPKYKNVSTGENAPKLFDERRSGKRMTANLEVRLLARPGSDAARAMPDRYAIVSAVNAAGYYANERREESAFLGTIGIIRDITERKVAEEQKRRLLEQLHQAQKMEALGQLAGGIAHDFNNMLSGITGYAQVIKRKNVDTAGNVRDTDLAKYISVVLKAAERAGDLTTKLLAFSRQGKYQTVSVNIHDCIGEVIGLLEHTIDRRISVVSALGAESALVVGDPAQIQNAILNLGMNALDAMAQDGGELRFSTFITTRPDSCIGGCAEELDAEEYLAVAVSDTGIGMTSEVRERLFEPFFTTKDVGKGTGLGLASVYGTIKSHGGAISIATEPHKGSTFILYFPLRRDVEPPPDTRKVPLNRGKGSVLIVDDEEIVCDILSHMLEELGYTVRGIARDGGEALSFYRENADSVDIIILDMNMPVMNGFDCFAGLKKINPDAKIIVATGYSVQSKTQKILTRGVTGFLQKPFKLDYLAEELRMAMQGDDGGA
jgi:PAS domain S-box-containing protein